MKLAQALAILLLAASSVCTYAQDVIPSAKFQPAKATKNKYQVVYQLNTDDDAKVKATLKNIQNALDDPRLKGKLTVELVVHGAGVSVFRKGKDYEALAKGLMERGVMLAMCENTMRERKISRDELVDFIYYVPSGNGELIIRQQHGWAFMHP